MYTSLPRKCFGLGPRIVLDYISVRRTSFTLTHAYTAIQIYILPQKLVVKDEGTNCAACSREPAERLRLATF